MTITFWKRARISAIAGTITVAALVLSSPAQASGQAPDTKCGYKVAIVGGWFFQPNFSQRYGLDLHLPIPEDEFLTIVKNLGLRFGAQGLRELHLENQEAGFYSPEVPVRTRNYDMRCITHSYRIYAGQNAATKWNEIYLALVSSEHEVVYIENRFESPPMP